MNDTTAPVPPSLSRIRQGLRLSPLRDDVQGGPRHHAVVQRHLRHPRTPLGLHLHRLLQYDRHFGLIQLRRLGALQIEDPLLRTVQDQSQCTP
jgi:hypothetical protein